MRINDLIVESQQLDELSAGDIGRGVGKVAGGLAKGVGAVAGGVAGMGRALKKGYQSGRAFVAGEPDPNAGDAAAATTTTTPGTAAKAAPATGGRVEPTLEPATTAADANAQGPKGTAPAQAQSGAAGAAMAKSAQAVAAAPNAEKAGQTLYAQVKASVNQLDKKGKQRILQLLQKSLAQPAPAAQPAAKAAPTSQPAAAPAAQPAPVQEPATTPAAAPAQQAEPTGEPTKKTKIANRVPKKRAPSQAEIDADRQRLMGPTSDSIIRSGNTLAEALAVKVELHKRKMFESSLSNGQASIFRK